MFQVLLVEDESKEANTLMGLLERYGNEHSLKFNVTWKQSGMDMLLEKNKYDLCFMDIKMPGINGLEAAEILRSIDETVPLIFVTNLAQYAVKGYEVAAQGFIVKPITYGSLSLNLDRALRVIQQNATRTIVISTDDGLRVVPFKSIVYIDVIKHKVSFHLDSETIETRSSLAQIEEELSGAPLLRISKNCMVNMNKIVQIRANDFYMTSGESLKISRTLKRQIVDTVTDYLGGHR